MNHPTDAEIEAYASRRLAAADVLTVDDHLAGCEACRQRALAAATRDGRPTPDLRAEWLPLESHLTETQMAALVDGTLAARERAEVEGHLRLCAPCAGEVQDLRAFARARVARPRAWYAYAAAAVVAVALLVPAARHWRWGST